MVRGPIVAQSVLARDPGQNLRVEQGSSMTEEAGKNASQAKAAREARLKAALRDNLKRRKSQARGRAGMSVVTPEDDARAHDEESSPEKKSGQPAP